MQADAICLNPASSNAVTCINTNERALPMALRIVCRSGRKPTMLPFLGVAMQLDTHRILHSSGRATPRTRSYFKGSLKSISYASEGEQSRSCTVAAASASSEQATQV